MIHFSEAAIRQRCEEIRLLWRSMSKENRAANVREAIYRAAYADGMAASERELQAIRDTVGDTEFSLRQQLSDMTRERDDYKRWHLSATKALADQSVLLDSYKQQVARLRECLVVAKCPTCDGSGWYHDTDSLTGEPVQAQCRWCTEQQALRETGAEP